MSQLPSREESRSRSQLRLGLFGATRSGKTVYLTTLYWIAKQGRLPEKISSLLPGDSNSAKYLGERYAMVEAGEWPAGNLDSRQIVLDVSFKSKVVTLATNDFRGGDFTAAFYSDDPANKARAEQFVSGFFEKCSAYLFLVDSGDFRDSLNDNTHLAGQNTIAQRSGAIETTLRILRQKAWGLRLFHHPVAVVFTKGDLHPECLVDPDAYAKQYLRPTWDYLRQHARTSHKFFAITSTGTVPLGLTGPPLPLQPSKNFFDPIVWCVEQHAHRLRVLRMAAAAVLVCVCVSLWTILFLHNGQRLRETAGELAQAQDDRLHELYVQAQGWQGWTTFTLTHPATATLLRQQIVGVAESRLQDSLAVRKGESGDLRTVDDVEEAEKQIADFAKGYPGTENAKHLTVWIATQRRQQAQQIVQRMGGAAKGGNERAFDDFMKDYARVASPDLDPEVGQLRDILDQAIVADQVKRLWYKWTIEPQNVDAIRGQCQIAEQTLQERRYQEKHHEFVQLLRNTYDQLNRNHTGKISFHLESKRNHDVSWWFEIDGHDVAIGRKRAAVKLSDGRWKIEGASATVDLLSPKKIRVAFNVFDRALNYSQLSTPLFTAEEFASHLQKPVLLKTETDDEYQVVFRADDQLVEHCHAMARIKELGDELFLRSTE